MKRAGTWMDLRRKLSDPFLACAQEHLKILLEWDEKIDLEAAELRALELAAEEMERDGSIPYRRETRGLYE